MVLRTFFKTSFLVLIIAAALAGCTKDVELLPRVRLTEPDSPNGGDVTVSFLLLERNERNASVIVTYTLDAGETWLNATRVPGGENMAELETTVTGLAHSFTWDSDNDLDVGNANRGDVRIRFTPYRGSKEGHYDTTGIIIIRNFTLADFAPPATLDNTGEAQASPSCAFDNSGDVLAVWEDGRGNSSRIYYARSADGGASFGTPLVLSGVDPANSSVMQHSPALVSDGVMNFYLAWTEERDNDSDVLFASSLDSGMSFGNVTRVDAGAAGTDADSPAIEYDDIEEQIFIAWADARSGGSAIYLGRSTDGGETFSEYEAAAAAGDLLNPRLAQGKFDRLFYVFEDRSSGNSSVCISLTDSDGADFYTPLEVDVSHAGPQVRPDVAVGRSGNAFVIYIVENGDAADVYLARGNTKGENFETPVHIGESIPAAAGGRVAVVADDAGLVYAAWLDNSTGTPSVAVTSFKEEEFPSGAAEAGVTHSGMQTPHSPSLFLNEKNIPLLFWIKRSSGEDRVFYAVGEE